jgi:hypothetical protein
MAWRKAYGLLLLVGALGWFAVGGCHSTTVEIQAEDSNAPPELFVEIPEHAAGQVSISKSSERDCLGGLHNTTRIEVPPGSKIIVLPSSRPLGGWRLTTMPASAACTQPETLPAE